MIRAWIQSLRWSTILVVIATAVVLIALLLPALRRVPPTHFEGMSEYGWMNQVLWHENPESRRKAAAALGEILRAGQTRNAHAIVVQLRQSGADGKPALPALRERLDSADADLRQEILDAIKRIEEESAKTAGDK